jgi:hypothetical protein
MDMPKMGVMMTMTMMTMTTRIRRTTVVVVAAVSLVLQQCKFLGKALSP